MASWQCTNKKIDGKTCGNIVESGVPPVGICSSCKKIGMWVRIGEGRPKLVRQQGQMPIISEEQGRKNRLETIIKGLKEPSMEFGLAGEILKFIRDVSSHEDRGWIGRQQSEERVKGRLRFCWGLFHNADYLAYELSPQSSWELLQDLDDRLKWKWDVAGGLLGGKKDYEKFASAPQELRWYGQEVIKRTEMIWRGLKPDEDKEKFLNYVFEHDKGYNRIIEFIGSWEAGVRPEELKKPDEIKPEKGVGGLDKGGGKKGFDALATIFKLTDDITAAMRGQWKGKVLYKVEVGSYQMTDFDLKTRQYTYKYLGPDDKRKQ